MPSTDLSATACSSSSFSAPHIFGTSILTLTASQVTNFSLSIPAAYWANHPALEVKSTSFCNVTVTYTHPKQNDKITVTAWLPDHDTWNERLLATGGGGYAAGGSYILSYYALAGSMATGYASITTNAGISETGYATDWALLSPGNIDLNALNNLGSVSLREQALIGKSLVRRYYGREEKYSYFTGCSQGGRQGLALAQRFPDLYDGIAASAPAINWSKVMLTMLWPHLIMNLAKEYPHSCELDHLTSLTIAACDGLDGVVDGLVTELESCKFDPFTAVGTKFFCAATNKTMKVSRIAAEVADATWKGPKTIDGKALWYGPGRGADLGGGITTEGIAETICDANSKCISAPFEFGLEWAKLFIEKNPDFDTRNITHKQYAEMFHIGEQQFHDFLGTDDPDLSAFRASGGKMLTYHGMADALIPLGGTEEYYDRVTTLEPKVHDFYRFFEAPGVQHCSGGNGGQPTLTFDALVAWVEHGIAPNKIIVQSKLNNGTINRILCPYPKKAVYNGHGDLASAGSFRCA